MNDNSVNFATSDEDLLLMTMQGVSAIVSAQLVTYQAKQGNPEVIEKLRLVSGIVFSLVEDLKQITKRNKK